MRVLAGLQKAQSLVLVIIYFVKCAQLRNSCFGASDAALTIVCSNTLNLLQTRDAHVDFQLTYVDASQAWLDFILRPLSLQELTEGVRGLSVYVPREFQAL